MDKVYFKGWEYEKKLIRLYWGEITSLDFQESLKVLKVNTKIQTQA